MARVMNVIPSSEDELAVEGPVGSPDDVATADYASLNVGLPAEVARLKAAGRLSEAIRAIDELLACGMRPGGMQPELASVLRVERHRMGRLAAEYPVTRAQALEAIRAECPGFTEEQLDELVANRRIDWRWIEGEQRFVSNFLGSLRIYSGEVPGLAPAEQNDLVLRDAMLAEMRENGGAARRITVRARIEVPGALPGETVRAWLPVPARCPQQSQIEVLSATPGAYVAPEDTSARTVHWESADMRVFEVEYRYVIRAPYVDTTAPSCGPVVGSGFEPVPGDLGELEPHIVFTPYLRRLASRLVRGIEDPLERARAIYDYITKNVDYRYQPAYAQLDCISDNCAKSLRADCGVFALTFITLCRIAGIPARWQSGLAVADDHIGCHDWAMFYTPERGWLWADCSFGSSARRASDEARRKHYFGNLDPWRMVANSEFMADFTPAFDGVRWDPFDNQAGEATVDGRGLDACEMRRTMELVEMERL